MASLRNIMNVNSFNERVWLLFLLATVGNVVDLIISYIGVVFLGCTRVMPSLPNCTLVIIWLLPWQSLPTKSL